MSDEPGTIAGSGWTEQEIIASVDSWISMYQMQQAGSSFVTRPSVHRKYSQILSMATLLGFLGPQNNSNTFERTPQKHI